VQAQEEQQLLSDQWERRDLDHQNARPDSVGEVRKILAKNCRISHKGVIAIRSMRRHPWFNPRISKRREDMTKSRKHIVSIHHREDMRRRSTYFMESGIEGSEEDSLDFMKHEVAKGIGAIYCGRTGVKDLETIEV
jgi:hypothetical protein